MSGTEINQVLAQMRLMAAAAGDGNPTEKASGADKVDFAALMKESISQVNEAQTEAKALATAFEAGEDAASLPEVMVALQKASISFQAMSQVRNKLLMAYQEVMKMQV